MVGTVRTRRQLGDLAQDIGGRHRLLGDAEAGSQSGFSIPEYVQGQADSRGNLDGLLLYETLGNAGIIRQDEAVGRIARVRHEGANKDRRCELAGERDSGLRVPRSHFSQAGKMPGPCDRIVTVKKET